MSAPSADRNLIFGLLALQMDFITREQLLDAMAAWMLDKQTPLGEILCRRGVLAEDERQVLDPALQKHLQRHGGDPQASLAALRVEASVRQGLDRLDDADVQASIASLAASADSSVDVLVTSAPVNVVSPVIRFRRLREHARGGLGEVFVALDGELNREVALKEIQDRFADRPDARGRFLREAEITGNLEHPGVVPVYGLGAYPDGRPYYATRFIRGESMQEAIERFHKADSDPRRDPGERSLALRDLLGRFVAVCHAVAYAHSRGVIHRDLKPANCMLGEYGETLVVDWGLARLLDQPHGEKTTAERPILAGSGSGTAPTEMGQVVGTPAYMPPEQAEGRLDRLGPTSDVFCLGATLYCLLTGHAPYTGPEALARARRVNVLPARQRKRSVPAALEAVCGKAMAKRPEERYGTAKVLAEEVQRFLADEPVSAYREPLTERVRRWTKRHRTLVAALVVGLVTATAALAVGLVLVNAEKERTRQALAAESAALERSQAAEKSASQQRQLALKTVRRVVYDIHARLKDRPEHKELRKNLLARALAGLKEVARAVDTAAQVDYGTIVAHLELGDIFLEIEEGGTAEAKKQYEKAHEVARRLVDADPDSALAQRQLAVTSERLGNVQMQLGDSKAALTAYQQSQAAAERLARADSQNALAQRDLSISHEKLGDVQMQLGDSKAALATYQRSLALREPLAKADPQSAQAQRDLFISYSKLGDVQMRLGDSNAALAAYKQSLTLAERQAKADPQTAQAQRGLSVSYEKLGDVQMQLGDSKTALATYQRSLAVCERLAKADPQNVQTQRDLSVSYEKLGNVQMRLGDSKTALAAYKQSLAGFERLAKADPQNAQIQRGLAVSHEKLGDVQMQLGDSKGALAAYQQSLEGFERLARADRQSAQAQRSLSISYNKVGDVQMQLGDSKAALTAYQHSLALAEPLARTDPTSAEAQRDLLVCYYNLGYLEQQSGEFSKAANWYVRALAVAKRFPRPDFFKKDLGPLENEIRICRAAVAVLTDPAAALKQPEDLRLPVLAAVASALARQKKPDKALAAADLLAANATEPGHLYDAACAYALCVPLADMAEVKEKRALRAIDLLRQAVAKGYKDAAHTKRDADLDALRGRDDFKKLLAEMEATRAKKTKPR
jgi:serine/threonine-protein kinase